MYSYIRGILVSRIQRTLKHSKGLVSRNQTAIFFYVFGFPDPI